MSRDRAAYMREYRARRAAQIGAAKNPKEMGLAVGYIINDVEDAAARIAELEAEVRYLKAELARRPSAITHATGGNGPILDRKAAQANRDAILRRIQTKPRD